MSDAAAPTTALGHVAAIPPYPPGRPIATVARELGLDPASIIKLASNENPLGCSPRAREAIARAAAETAFYPDFDCYDLKVALARANGLAPEQVLPGAGSSDLILQVSRGWLDATRHAVVPQYSFAAYESTAKAQNARVVEVPARGWDHDLAALVEAARAPGAAVLFLATPNNPTGTAVAPAALEAFVREVPEDVLIVLDEAYRDFQDEADRPDIHRLMALRRNLVVLRTFSKLHGLAALRVGYAIAEPAIVSILKRLQMPFATPSAAQAAAVAALEDDDFAEGYRTMNREQRDRLQAAFAARGLDHVPSQANFVLFEVGDGPAVFQALMRKGVITRPMANYGLKTWLRVSIGTPEQNTVFLDRLDEVLAERSAAA